MLGSLRLALAVMVALSHVEVAVAGMNPGVVAVVVFYLISGYVMTGLVRRHYPSPALAGRFYADRALRLLPHYYAIATITLAWFLSGEFRSYYLSRSPSAGNLVENFLVVPLNFYMFNDSMRFALVPPAWSLGAEIQFYIVFPFILLANARTALLAASAVVYGLAVFGVLNPDWFGYRLLPGVLFMFLAGSCLYDLSQPRAGRGALARFQALVLCLAALVALALAVTGNLSVAVNRETLLGLAFGIPLVLAAASRPSGPIDEYLGHLSYGVFLNHFFVRWAFFGDQVSGMASVFAYLGGSILLAVAGYHAVERPALAWRKRLRKPA